MLTKVTLQMNNFWIGNKFETKAVRYDYIHYLMSKRDQTKKKS